MSDKKLSCEQCSCLKCANEKCTSKDIAEGKCTFCQKTADEFNTTLEEQMGSMIRFSFCPSFLEKADG